MGLIPCYFPCYCYGMERAVTRSIEQRRKNHGGSFRPVLDTRKRKIPGLWKRDDIYYAQLRVPLGNGKTAPRRIALVADSLDQARAELERKRTERRDDALPQRGRRPGFEDFAQEYLVSATLGQKKIGTQQNERQAIRRWVGHLGGVRIDKITPPVIHSFREKRLESGASARTVNLDTVALRNVLKFAVDQGEITRLPEVKQLKQKPSPKRRFFSPEQLDRLLSAVSEETTKNSKLFKNYLQFLSLTGAREQESLGVRWSDVDFEHSAVTIGSGGVSKNHKQRQVDFSPGLEALLGAMYAERPPGLDLAVSLAPARPQRRSCTESPRVTVDGPGEGRPTGSRLSRPPPPFCEQMRDGRD